MKKIILASVLASVVILGIQAKMNQSDSETYAVVHVTEKAKRLIIRTTVDGMETRIQNIESGYVEEEDMPNFEPVLQELNWLNSQGYELVNGSVSSITYGNRGKTTRPFHSFLFKKRK